MIEYKFIESKQQGNGVHARYNISVGVSNTLIPSAITFLEFKIP